MKFKIESHKNIGIIKLEGDFLSEIDQSKLREKVRDLLNHGQKKFIIDMKKVKHTNSCGLGALVCSFTSVRRVDGELILTGVGKPVEELLKITKLNTIFKISPSLKQAIDNLCV